MSVEVTLTVGFSFANGSAKPTMSEIANFVKALDADPGEMLATYRIAEEKSLFIKFRTEEAMRHCLVLNSDQLLFKYADGKTAEVRMSPAGGNVQYVRVYDLPPEVPDSDLAMVLGKYGDVKRVVREKFPAELNLDMFTGVRGAYVDVKKVIPNSLHFRNRKGNIFYDGNKNLCFLCNMNGHLMSSCPKRKIRKQHQPAKENQQQKDEERVSTYADAVTGAVATPSGEHNSNATGEAVEEVLEEEVVQIDEASTETGENNTAEATSVEKPQPRVFKYPNDAYYFYKFGIEDYTEKERLKDEEEAKRLALWKENRLREEKELRERKKAEENSPPRKSKKAR